MPITKNSDDYDKKCMKIKFNSNDDLPLNKIIKIDIATMVVRAIFYENNKYYPQVFLDDFFIMIELIFLKQLMLIRQANQKSDVCP